MRGGAGESFSRKMVKVTTRKEGNLTHFFVENLEAGDVTATFSVGLDNLKGTVKFPYTSTYPPHQVTEAFTLSPLESNRGWGYTYTNQFTMGNHLAVHDHAAIYELPYAAGGGFRVTQGYNGTYSHTGPDQYAIDFKMPGGTPIHAARKGVVVKVKDDSDLGGPNRKYETCANYILIQHPDGTLANYAHLQKSGCRVKLGQEVRAGDLIALSGNTGFTSGPHLHFSVFKTRADGGGRESIPVNFRTADASAITLVEGQNYKPLSPDGRAYRGHLTLTSPKDDHRSGTGAPQRN
jgi:murein DD-endopeptidase MepM/ murein hydrolase activator NlpD